jgi:hypothetical protein
MSAAAPTAPIVDLSTLTAKQQLKEFKAAAKEVRSKDEAVKERVLAKFRAHPRYLDIEGGCAVPFLEAIMPKKVSFYVRIYALN